LPTSLESTVDKFNYNAPAELFPSRNRKIAKKVKYRRFDRAAEAIRYAVEELPEPLLLGAFIEMDNERLGHKDIRALYESADYPLTKRAS
jgi:Arc/MetJ-type ribon-helix-helix transcriptional regulator